MSLLCSLAIVTSVQAETANLATAQQGGTYYAIGRALAEREEDIKVVCTNGSLDNINGLEDQRYSFGVVQSDILHDFVERAGHPRLKVIAALYSEPVYILVRNKLRISEMKDLKGKIVAVGLPGSGTKYTAETLLGIFGISLRELSPAELGYEDIAIRFAEESLDAAFVVNSTLPASIQSLANNKTICCLKLGRRDLSKIAATYPSLYALLSIPEPANGSRKLLTISVDSVLVAGIKADSDIVERLAARVYDNDFRNSPYFGDRRPRWKSWPFRLYATVGTPDLFHEAALKYYHKKSLILKYNISSAIGFSFPLVMLALVFAALFHRRTRSLIRLNSWVWTTYVLVVIIALGYFLLFLFERNAGNPDITGWPLDLIKVLLFVFQTGELSCVTAAGTNIRTAMLVASGVFVAVMTARIAAYFVGTHILEVFEMLPQPRALSNHVLLCNRTTKLDGIIKELRSALLDKPVIVVLANPTTDAPDEFPDTPEYDNVFLLKGDPADPRYLRRANASAARSVLIMADERNSTEPDARSLMILLSLRAMLSKEDKPRKPHVVVEVLTPVYVEHMYNAGADSAVAYSDIAHKLLAQAIVTPGVIAFLHEILTTTDDSNEVYIVDIPAEYCGQTFQEFASAVMTKFAATNNPLLVIGVKSDGRLCTNPRQEHFSTIRRTDQAVVLAWTKPSAL